MQNDTCKLSEKTRFFVIKCTPPANHGEVVKRKKGYISFLQESNASKLAAKLAAKTPGSRFYVSKLVGGAFIPASPTLTVRTYS